jgi:hypothetical protein
LEAHRIGAGMRDRTMILSRALEMRDGSQKDGTARASWNAMKACEGPPAGVQEEQTDRREDPSVACPRSEPEDGHGMLIGHR